MIKSKAPLPRVTTLIHGNVDIARLIAATIMPPTLVIVSNEPTQWWAAMDCACALENIFLAAKSLGIGSCWINQLGQTCDDPDVRAFLTKLGVPESHKVYGCAALGYAPADAPVKEKKGEGRYGDHHPLNRDTRRRGGGR